MLSNYQYIGVLAKLIPHARIVHTFRNPLDNILSIYRAHFSKGYSYASFLEDIAAVWMHQDQVIKEYKKVYRSNIYDLNYDKLVTNPNDEIKQLISWLGWDWEDLYLQPHLNSRSVSTASHVQVRSPITAKSVGGWKNYQQLLQPAISFIRQSQQYHDFIFS
tara:strand:- start:45 stop:530 length:486 start_codon:yes stop_codon:yes gene_type:complete